MPDALSLQNIFSNVKESWIKIGIVVLILLIIVGIIKAVTRKIRITLEKKISQEKIEVKKRTLTFTSVVSNLVILIGVVVALLIVADELGIQIAPILAGAGIAGIIVGLGAQSLIKDLINGTFILFEQWFQVNDIVTIGDVSGVVEKFSLRTTVLRDLEGVVHYIPNGEIKILSNRTQQWARAVVDVAVHYKEDTDRVINVLESIFDEFMEDERYKKFIIERPVILGDGGVDSLGDSAVVFKVVCTVKPPNQWTIARQLRKRIKDRFDKEGIEIPFPCRSVYIKENLG